MEKNLLFFSLFFLNLMAIINLILKNRQKNSNSTNTAGESQTCPYTTLKLNFCLTFKLLGRFCALHVKRHKLCATHKCLQKCMCLCVRMGKQPMNAFTCVISL